MATNYHPVPWKRNISKTPDAILNALFTINSNLVVVAATKKVAVGDIEKGIYHHIGLRYEEGQVIATPSVVPSENLGRFSTRNIEGWKKVRRDLPKITKTFYWETPNFGDEFTYGTHMHYQDREVYQSEYYEPRFLAITTEILKAPDNGKGFALVKFAIAEILDRTHVSFDHNLFFSLNLLQENVGAIGVYASTATREEYIGTIALDWEVFPPGTAAEVIALMSKGKGITPRKSGVLEDRIKLFSSLKPITYLRGTGGLNSYIGAQFADDLVVFENMNYGNALYILYQNWEDVSKRSRIDLLKGTDINFDRFVHTDDWKERFIKHMRRELRKRNIGRKG